MIFDFQGGIRSAERFLRYWKIGEHKSRFDEMWGMLILLVKESVRPNGYFHRESFQEQVFDSRSAKNFLFQLKAVYVYGFMVEMYFMD